MRATPSICALSLLAVLLPPCSRAEEWNRFRGPNGSGVDSAAGYPIEFSPLKNVVWKATVPFAQSSPIVYGDRLFLTAVEADKLLTLCLDAQTGRQLWRRELARGRNAKIFRANDSASPTPAADSQGVLAFFPDFGLVAYTPEGKESWRQPLGPFKNFYGMAASPLIANNLVVLVCDQQSGSYLLGLDRSTGERRWRTERAGMTIGWATPIVYQPATGSAELIVLGTTSVDSYYLATGERRWWMPLQSGGGLGTPSANGDTILISTAGSDQPQMPTWESVLAQYDKDKDGRLSYEEFKGDPDFGEHFGWIDADDDKFIEKSEWDAARSLGMGAEYGAVAIRPGGAQGALPASAVVWRVKKRLPYIPAPLLYRDVFYLVRTGGIVTSLNPATGEVLKQGRSNGAPGDYYASPVAADGKIYMASEDGKITVLKAGAQWDILSVNDMAEEIHATPALSRGRIYVRTHGAIYCFASAR
jgi:outer membrane protein assembly factor BamB